MLKTTHRTIALVILALAGAQALPAAAQSEPFIGQTMCAGFNYAPRGWMEMNGQTLSIAQNQALFALLGTMYGGNGQTTFALPDMRGRTMLHAGQGPGLSPRQQGDADGTEVISLTGANLPPHAHNFAPLASTNDATSITPAGKVPAAKARTTLYTEPANLVAEATGVTSTAGGGLPVNNMQPSVTLKCFIAIQGIFPSRD